ncbi:MAG: YeeE/YedE thiosulfate transporter family protein [Bacteroidia bacterium]|nr:YeeE/YedE thiosulfate transporter family protein [Bacteroidia bacterium]
MQKLIHFLSDPWPWYVAGPLIGLMIPTLLFVINKDLGISSSFRHMCAMTRLKKISFFDYDWREYVWNLNFVFGIFLSGIIVSLFFPNPEEINLSENFIAWLQEMGVSDIKGFLPGDIFQWSFLNSPRTLIILIGGGFFIGFGSRYAGGCTSGHAIMGLSQLSIGSLIAVIGFFIGGLIVSWFLLPFILTL